MHRLPSAPLPHSPWHMRIYRDVTAPSRLRSCPLPPSGPSPGELQDPGGVVTGAAWLCCGRLPRSPLVCVPCFLTAAQGFGFDSEVTGTLPTRSPVIPLLRATVTRGAGSYSSGPFLSNFSSSNYKHLQRPYKVPALRGLR